MHFNMGEDDVFEKDAPPPPILEDDVIVYAGARILEHITIGKVSCIGGNDWLTRSVPT